ncbi:MAG: YwiC-like family protein [Acidobacteria bacterium]|nr:YwiC-like family protein [Acidobacteriota bacterium]
MPKADSITPHPSAAPSRSWLLLPREHGAWGMVGLPFLAAATIAEGNRFSLPAAAAILAVLSAFLLRDPLLLLRRIGRDPGRLENSSQRVIALRSLFLCLGGLTVSGTILLLTLPPLVVLGLGAAGLALVIASVQIAVERIQREISSQLLSVAGLTGSCLVAYLAVHGRLDWLAFTIWTMSAVHSVGSVLVVRARLEGIVSRRRSAPEAARSRFYRGAIAWQAGLASLLAVLALTGHAWFLLPFLPPGALHVWELWRFRSGEGWRLSMHQVGWLQLAASLLFYSLLVLLFRSHLIA